MRAGSVTVTVDSQTGPWNYSAGLNSTYTYGVGDFTSPVVISSGFDFSAGGTFTITALSGMTSPYGGTPYADAGGDTAYVANDTSGSSGNYFPSLYFNSSDYPAYLNELVGTFTDSSGAIVGTPFNIGLMRSITVPSGASQLQLGLNDDIFSDNTGSLSVQVSGPGSVPDGGSTLALLSLACAGVLGVRRYSAA